MKMKEILCYRNNKMVLRVRCILNEDHLSLMIKNKMIFYMSEDLKSTEFIFLDNFDKVVINDDLYSNVLEILYKESEKL